MKRGRRSWGAADDPLMRTMYTTASTFDRVAACCFGAEVEGGRRQSTTKRKMVVYIYALKMLRPDSTAEFGSLGSGLSARSLS